MATQATPLARRVDGYDFTCDICKHAATTGIECDAPAARICIDCFQESIVLKFWAALDNDRLQPVLLLKPPVDINAFEHIAEFPKTLFAHWKHKERLRNQPIDKKLYCKVDIGGSVRCGNLVGARKKGKATLLSCSACKKCLCGQCGHLMKYPGHTCNFDDDFEQDPMQERGVCVEPEEELEGGELGDVGDSDIAQAGIMTSKAKTAWFHNWLANVEEAVEVNEAMIGEPWAAQLQFVDPAPRNPGPFDTASAKEFFGSGYEASAESSSTVSSSQWPSRPGSE